MSYQDWHVGMKVVCVNAAGAENLVERGVYTIAAIRPKAGFSRVLGWSTIGILLHEAKPNKGHNRFHPDRFRPVQKRKTDISLFTQMLADATPKVNA